MYPLETVLIPKEFQERVVRAVSLLLRIREREEICLHPVYILFLALNYNHHQDTVDTQ